MKNLIKHLYPLPIIIQLVLLIPLVCNVLLDDFNWNMGDFILMSIMLFILGVLIQLLHRWDKTKKYFWWMLIGLILLFLVIWIEFAVGIMD